MRQPEILSGRTHASGATPLDFIAHAIANDDHVLVHISDAHLYVGLKRSAIYQRMSPSSGYYDARFPKPAPYTGRKTHFYRGDLIAYVRLLGSDSN